MNDLKVYADIIKVDKDKRLVYGYASTEALDSQGERVSKSAVEEALPDYMRWANIREMHEPSAVGVAKKADIDEKGLYLVAKIVDDIAWNKVKEGVYKGFSVGGKKLSKVEDVVTKCKITEISIVDRPANPECAFDLYKVAEREDTNPKEGKKKYGDVTFADEKNKKYPIDTEEHVRAALSYWGMPKNRAKYSAADQKTIAGKIRAAASKFGIGQKKETKKMDKIEIESKEQAQEVLAKYAGEEISDVSSAVYALQSIAYLYQKEMSEAHPEAEEQIKALQDAITAIKNFIVSEIQESDPDDVINLAEKIRDFAKSATPVDLESFQIGFRTAWDEIFPDAPLTKIKEVEDLEKVGAKIGKENMSKVQAIHDHAVSMGAECAKCDKSEKSEGDEDMQKIEQLKKEKTEALAKVETLTTENEALKKEVETLKASPAPAKGVTNPEAVTVTKVQDGGGTDNQETMNKIEALAKVSPEAAAQELIKFVHTLKAPVKGDSINRSPFSML